MSFGELLVRWRRIRDLSQEELAQDAGIAVRTVSDLERGVARTARKATAQLLADALQLEGQEREHFLAVARGRPASAPEVRPPTPAAVDLAAVDPAAVDPAAVAPVATADKFPLHGRAVLLDELDALLRDSPGRIVTLLGPGGVGKTSIAVHLSHRAAPSWPDGVVVVRMETLRLASALLPTLARELQLRDGGGVDTAAALVRALAGKRMLIVLDNLEQIVEGAGDLVPVLSACPDLTVLVTSRVALRVRGEILRPVPPLVVPDEQAAPGDLLAVPAVALFVERVRQVWPGWEATTEDLAGVAEICRRLDGVPLALELAARRVRLLGVHALLERSGGLALLSRGPRDAPERHRTLRDTIAWSHDLLEKDARRVFRRTAAFAGVFPAAAAEQVCRLDGESLDVLDALDDLLDASMIVPGPRPGELTMLHTVREFASELFEGCAERDRIALQHAEYAARIAADSGHSGVVGTGAPRVDWHDVRDDLLRAMSTCLAAGVPGPGVAVLAATWRQWLAVGDIAEVLDVGCRLLALGDDDLTADADRAVRAQALKGAANLARELDRSELAARLCDRALAAFTALDDRFEVASCLNGRGTIEWFRGRNGQAQPWFERAVEAARRADGAEWLAVMARYNMVLALLGTDPAQALALADAAFADGVDLGRVDVSGCTHNGRGLARARTGDHAGAVEDFLAAGRAFLSAGDQGLWLCRILDNLAVSTAALGDPTGAAVRFGAAEAVRRRMNLGINHLEREHHLVRDALLATGGAVLGAAYVEGLRCSWTSCRELVTSPSSPSTGTRR